MNTHHSTLFGPNKASTDTTIMKFKTWLRDQPPSYFVFFGLLIVVALFANNLMNLTFTSIILRQSAPLGVMVLGQALVMRAGSIDLSVAGLSALVIYLITSGVLSDLPPASLVLIPLLAGIVIGLINGFLVAYVRASSVMITLGITTVLFGLVSWLTTGQPPGAVPHWLNSITNEKLLGVSYSVYIWIILTILFSFLMGKLVFGKYIASIGDNPKAALISGLPVPRTIFWTHVIASFLGALGSVLQTSALGVGSIKPGLDVVMNAISAAILGAVTFGSGKGGVKGPFVAVLAFGYLFAVLTVFGVQESGKLMVQGIVIAVAAISAGTKRR